MSILEREPFCSDLTDLGMEDFGQYSLELLKDLDSIWFLAHLHLSLSKSQNVSQPHCFSHESKFTYFIETYNG